MSNPRKEFWLNEFEENGCIKKDEHGDRLIVCPDNFLVLKINLGKEIIVISNGNFLYLHDFGAVPYAVIRDDFITYQETDRKPKTMYFSEDRIKVPITRLVTVPIDNIQFYHFEEIFKDGQDL